MQFNNRKITLSCTKTVSTNPRIILSLSRYNDLYYIFYVDSLDSSRVHVFITLLNRSFFLLFIFFSSPRSRSPRRFAKLPWPDWRCARASDNRLGSLGNDRSNYQATLMGNLHDTVALRDANGGGRARRHCLRKNGITPGYHRKGNIAANSGPWET